MSDRASRRLAWGLAASAVLLMLGAEALALATGAGAHRSPGSGIFIWAIVFVFSAVGALIASRRPGNAIGWLFLGAGVAAGSIHWRARTPTIGSTPGTGPLCLARRRPCTGTCPGSPGSSFPRHSSCCSSPTAGCCRDGGGRSLGAPRRQSASASWPGGCTPATWRTVHSSTNPYGVESPVVDALQGLSWLLLLIAIVGSAAPLILRFRRAHGEQRQQMKWLALAGAVAGTFVIAFTILYDVVGEAVANVAIMLSVLSLPLAAGIAILRYRLYDIDVVINRTLVYGALTATLAAAYLGCVLLLQLAARRTHGRLEPRRRRLDARRGGPVPPGARADPGCGRPPLLPAQVRRHSARSRRSATRLRDQVDLGALNAELNSVVRDTLQPAHVSLWLRAPGGGP